MIELTDVAYVRSGVADPDKAVAFATDIVRLELGTGPESAPGPRSCGRTGGSTGGSRDRIFRFGPYLVLFTDIEPAGEITEAQATLYR